MKTIFFTTVCIFLSLSNISAQVEELDCTGLPEKLITYQGQIGGFALPSSGTLNVLIVFCQFPDDNYNINDPYWQKGSPPDNMNEWVNQT